MRLAAAALTALLLAGPAAAQPAAPEPVLVIIDVSGSMGATSVRVSRSKYLQVPSFRASTTTVRPPPGDSVTTK